MKLPEAVEWLERDYDNYVTERTRWDEYGEYESELRHTYWFNPGEMTSGGPIHRQPFFTFKPNAGGPQYHWWGDRDFVPLSPESMDNPTDPDRVEAVLTAVGLS